MLIFYEVKKKNWWADTIFFKVDISLHSKKIMDVQKNVQSDYLWMKQRTVFSFFILFLNFSVQSLSQVRLCNSMDCSTPGFPVHHQLLEFTQTHVCRVGDGQFFSQLLGGAFWQNMVHWRREWQTTSVFLPWEPHEQHERQKDRTLKDELPRSVGAQCAAGDEWRNSSRKDEGMEPEQKQQPAVGVTGDRSKAWCYKSNIAQEPGMLGPWIKVNWKRSVGRRQEWTLTF